MAQASEELRRDKRKPVNVIVEFKDEKKVHEAITENLSLGGMFVTTKKPLQITKKTFFRLIGKSNPLSFNLEGEVVWNNGRGCRSHRKDLPHGMGIKFLDSNILSKDALTGFVNFIEESDFRICV